MKRSSVTVTKSRRAEIRAVAITDPQLRAQASRHAGQTWGVWLFFGSIGLAILLGSLGILPGTRRKTRQA
jgi:hypothetical protein